MLNKWKKLLLSLTAASQLLLPACKTAEVTTYKGLEEGIKIMEAELQRGIRERKPEERQEEPFYRQEKQIYYGPAVLVMPFDDANRSFLRELSRTNNFRPYEDSSQSKKERWLEVQRKKILEEEQRRLDNPNYKPSGSRYDLRDVFSGFRKEILSKSLREELESEIENFFRGIPLVGDITHFGYRGLRKFKGFVTNSIKEAVGEIGIRPYDEDFRFNMTQDSTYFGVLILFSPRHSLSITGDFDSTDGKKGEERLLCQIGIKF